MVNALFAIKSTQQSNFKISSSRGNLFVISPTIDKDNFPKFLTRITVEFSEPSFINIYDPRKNVTIVSANKYFGLENFESDFGFALSSNVTLSTSSIHPRNLYFQKSEVSTRLYLVAYPREISAKKPNMEHLEATFSVFGQHGEKSNFSLTVLAVNEMNNAAFNDHLLPVSLKNSEKFETYRNLSPENKSDNGQDLNVILVMKNKSNSFLTEIFIFICIFSTCLIWVAGFKLSENLPPNYTLPAVTKL